MWTCLFFFILKLMIIAMFCNNNSIMIMPMYRNDLCSIQLVLCIWVCMIISYEFNKTLIFCPSPLFIKFLMLGDHYRVNHNIRPLLPWHSIQIVYSSLQYETKISARTLKPVRWSRHQGVGQGRYILQTGIYVSAFQANTSH